MPNDVITDAIVILKKIREEDIVTVKFKKKDGTMRIMKCTLNFKMIPKKDQPKGVDLSKILSLVKESKIIHVYDLEAKGWRSIPVDRTEYVETQDKKYSVRIK